MISWAWRPGLCITAILYPQCPSGEVAARSVSKQFGTWLTTTSIELHLNSPGCSTASCSWLFHEGLSASTWCIFLIPSPTSAHTISWAQVYFRVLFHLRDPSVCLILQFFQNSIALCLGSLLRPFISGLFSQGLQLTALGSTPSGDSLLPSSHLCLSLEHTLPVPTLSPHCLLAFSWHLPSCCADGRVGPRQFKGREGCWIGQTIGK